MYRIIRAKGHYSTVWQPVVNHTSPQTSTIEIVGVHEMHDTDKEKVEMEVTQVLVVVAFHEFDKELL